MTQQEREAELQFRRSIEDSLEILRKLEPHAGSLYEVIQLLEVALVNETQLRFLWSKFVKPTVQTKAVVG